MENLTGFLRDERYRFSLGERYLGFGIANLINIFNPDKVVLSGGVAQIGDRLFNRVREEAEKRSFDVPFRRVQILPARLGLDTGAIGMAGILRMTLANG